MEDNRTSAKPTLNISLALSGGASRGTFHLGFIEALQENNVRIMAISGCSAGSLAGGAIACGVKPKEILEILKSVEFKKVFKFCWFSKSIFEIDLKAKVLDKLFLFDNLEETKIPFFACVTDIDAHEVLYLKKGNAKKLIGASCALIPFFKPINYEGRVLVDGGILDLMPTSPLQDFEYPILGINILPSFTPKNYTLKTLITRVIALLIASTLPQDIKRCKWYIAPKEISNFKMFSFKGLEKCFDLGYDYGKKWCEENLG